MLSSVAFSRFRLNPERENAMGFGGGGGCAVFFSWEVLVVDAWDACFVGSIIY